MGREVISFPTPKGDPPSIIDWTYNSKENIFNDFILQKCKKANNSISALFASEELAPKREKKPEISVNA